MSPKNRAKDYLKPAIFVLFPVRDTELGTKHFTKVCIKRFREKIGNLLAWNVYNLGNFYYVFLFIYSFFKAEMNNIKK